MTSTILRSYQVFGANDQVLAAAQDAVKQAVKDAKSKGSVQRVALHRRGYRHDIEVGVVYVVPTSVCNSPEDFPTILLDANLRKVTTGEGMVEFQMGALVDSDELSRETLQAFKEVVFKNEKGDYAPLIVFAAAWAHPSAYQSFVYSEDTLLANLRDVAYASPFDPSLSAAFDQLRAVDPDQAPTAKILPITQHIYRVPASEKPDYPEFAKGLDVAGEEGAKKSAGLGRRPVIRLVATDIPKLEHEDLSDAEKGMFQAIEAEVKQNVKQAGTYQDTDFGAHAALRATPDYGEEGTKETVHPSQVDGPSAMTASEEPKADNANVVLNGLAPNMTEGDTAPADGADQTTAMQTKEAGLFGGGAEFAAGTVQAVNSFVSHWGGKVLSEEGLKSELKKVTDKLKPAVLFMKEQGLIQPYGQGQYKILNRDLAAEEKDRQQGKLSFVIKDPKTQSVWAAAMVDGVPFGGSWSKDASEAARFASKTAAADEIRRNDLGLASIVAKTCDGGHECDGSCDHKEATSKAAGKWWNPGTVIEQFYPELQHDVVDSPFISQAEDPNLINPFGAPGKGTSQDPAAMGLNQGLDSNAGGVPLRQEMSFYGPEYARNFYAPHADIPGKALTFKRPKAASAKQGAKKLIHTEGNVKVYWDGEWQEFQCVPNGNMAAAYHTDDKQDALTTAATMAKSAAAKQANPALLLPLAEAALPAAEAAAGAGAAGAAAGGAEAAGGLSVGDALAMVPPPQQDENKQASKKRAGGAMVFFQGLDMAAPDEEHPQAHVDETAATPETGEYVEPSAEEQIGEDPTFTAVDKLLKGTVGAYAAQLIQAFQATNRPLSMAAPFTDKLDIAETLRVAGGTNSPAAGEAAIAQFQTAMNKLNDDQKKLLVEGCFAQAAVWCNNTKGSGGFNYEVFVRAESLDGTTLMVKVVTGTK